jgi:hypothetical protein
MLRGEAALLREAEASQPRDGREPTCQTITTPLMPRRNPERIDLAAIKTDLEFLMERLSKLPTRQELALTTALRIVGSAPRHCLDRVIQTHLPIGFSGQCVVS